MIKPSPLPTQTRRPKNRSIIAIVLAVLLHVVIALVIYFTVFKDKPSSILGSSPIDGASLISTTSVITKDQRASSETAAVKDNIKDTTPQASSLQNNKKTTDANNNLVNKNAAIDQKQSSIIEDTTQGSNIYDSPNQPMKLTANDDAAGFTDSDINNQQSPPEYRLKQTKQYQQLDAEIDKNNEQLAKLIDEVKKRNQSQIQQHQTPKPNASDIKNTPAIESDYPITPITSLSEATNDK